MEYPLKNNRIFCQFSKINITSIIKKMKSIFLLTYFIIQNKTIFIMISILFVIISFWLYHKYRIVEDKEEDSNTIGQNTMYFNKKKNGLWLLGIFVFLLVLVATNPNEQMHQNEVKSKIMKILQKEIDPSKEILGEFSSVVGSYFIEQMVQAKVTRVNYFLFSTTNLNWDGKTRIIGIGMLNNIFIFPQIENAVNQYLGRTKNQRIPINKKSETFKKEITYDIKGLLQIKNPKQLYKQYGEENIRKGEYEGLDGDSRNGREYVLYPNSKNEVRINFDKGIIRLNKGNSEWKLDNGLYVGCSLEDTKIINGGDFYIYGFEWDYGGSVQNWGNGNLAKDKIWVQFSTDVNLDYDEYSKVTGDKIFSSSNPIMRKLKLKVSEILINNN